MLEPYFKIKISSLMEKECVSLKNNNYNSRWDTHYFMGYLREMDIFQIRRKRESLQTSSLYCSVDTL